MKHTMFGLISLCSFLLFACESRDILTCNSNSNCPPAHICVELVCQQPCSADIECATGEICNAATEFCENGNRNNPVITEVFGNSSEDCILSEIEGATGPTGKCIGDGFIINGSNLSGAEFSIRAAAGSPTFVFNTVSNNGTQAEITTDNADIPSGEYSLLAVNMSGSDEESVKLLRGESGSTGGGGTLIEVNDSGAPTQSDFGPTRVVVTASDEANAIDVSAYLNDYCQDSDGCKIRIGVTGMPFDTEAPLGSYTSADFSNPSLYMGEEMTFSLSASGNWTVSNLIKDVSITGVDSSDIFYNPSYFTPRFNTGRDGTLSHPDGTSPGQSGNQIFYQRLCVLTDATMPGGTSSVPSLDGACGSVPSATAPTDSAPGFAFGKIPSVYWASCDAGGTGILIRDYAESFLSDPNGSCTLIIED